MTELKRVCFGLTLLTAVLGLSSCGGGGGGGAAEPTRPLSVTITGGAAALLSNKGEIFYEPGTQFATTLSVNVRRASGQPVGDGTSVGLSVNNSNLGLLSTVDDLALQTASLTVATTAGNASAVFHTQDGTGTAVVTASVTDATANQTISATFSIAVNEGPDGVMRITLLPNRLSIPARPASVPVFFDSPYIAEVGIEFRGADGTLASPQDAEVGVGISPLALGAFSTLDDPETEDINEFFVLLGNGPVETAGGIGTVFVHSFDSPGQLTLTVNGQDNVTGEIFDAQLTIDIVEPGSDGRPANVQFDLPGTPQYVQGAGGNSAQSFQVFVSDGGGEAVANPPAGVNNLFLQIFTESPDSGAVLRATSANGTAVEGTSIAVPTTNGVTSASLVSGTEPGLVRIRAIADAADNNVSNGIQAEVVSETTMVVSDGIPFSVTITTIPINSLTVNPVDPAVVVFDDNGFPVEPNATYSLRVNAIVTDRFGNPPAQSVSLQTGLVDAPISGFPTEGAGTFDLSGVDGDPFEGGTGFFAPNGLFVSAGGGAGPGDTLILFGKEVVGNADHESARTVTQIIDQNDLIVDEPFNLNAFTGASVNDGPVLPYLIGRATTGNIESNVATDSNGVASTLLNYPVSQLGRTAALYFQGSNGGLGGLGNLHTFADAVLLRYPGLEPLTLTATPDSIPANTPSSVLVCLEDAAQAPIRGQFIGFAFSELEGTGSVDGIQGSGTTANPTGADGCVVALVETSGIGTDATDGGLIFFSGDARDDVVIVPPGSAVLQASPTSFRIPNTPTTVNVTLRYLAGGAPVAGIAISGTCTATDGNISIVQQPPLTDANGEAIARIQAQLNDGTFDTEVGSGTCTFETSDGITADIEFQGFDTCANQVNVSPAPPAGACQTGGGSNNFSLTMEFDQTYNPTGTVTATATGAAISCVFSPGSLVSGTCSDPMIPQGTNVTLTLTFDNMADQDQFTMNGGWLGQCQSAGTNPSASVTVNNDAICRADF